ncbi:MAG TPA: cell division protein FtsQ/DivIB [Hypericibacter adhaerens]|jgi:cell division protein FtsQ|uniref:cell division protein FtsQ/DivIB n=1 Tax=Hypericibacter adhaerens TaxID=2602016 RepID=UPI002C836756|nr:cell division protein FtsQ/DivIB [Hypericibacter adhaerens]HWA43409.1 cell division protein FtsQ/DivIB [Hypericibacter adhaerens]
MRRVTAKPRASQPRAKAKPRRDPRSLRRQRLQRQAAIGAALLAIAGAGWMLWPSEWIQRQGTALGDGMVALSGHLGLTLQSVTVDGREQTPPEELLAAIGADRGTPILALDPAAIRARVENLPWVKSASVHRGLDGNLKVHIDEFAPFALWQRDGKFYLVDREGEAIAASDPGRFSQLLVLVGDNAPQHASDLVAMLGLEPELKARVKAAVWVGDRRWNLRLDNGVDVKLPETNPTAAWLQLARLEREQGLLKRDLSTIDLRLPDRMVVRLAPGSEPAAAKPTAPGSDT